MGGSIFIFLVGEVEKVVGVVVGELGEVYEVMKGWVVFGRLCKEMSELVGGLEFVVLV